MQGRHKKKKKEKGRSVGRVSGNTDTFVGLKLSLSCTIKATEIATKQRIMHLKRAIINGFKFCNILVHCHQCSLNMHHSKVYYVVTSRTPEAIVNGNVACELFR